jgi:hypothetical protein
MQLLQFVGKYTPQVAIEAICRVQAYLNYTFQKSGLMPHRGRNAPKRITSSQRRAAKRAQEVKP